MSGTPTLDRDMVVDEFDDERLVNKHHHKGEQVYLGKFVNIHKKSNSSSTVWVQSKRANEIDARLRAARGA